MNGLDGLLGRTGTWEGTNRLWLDPAAPPDESPSTVDVTAVLGGRFVRLDQRWAYQGKPQEGMLLVGHDPKAGVARVYFADTLHMGRAVMTLTGTVEPDGTVDVRGTYPVGSGPDWGWHVRLGGDGPDRLRITMYNVEPGDPDQLAVDGEFTRRA